jgi:RNA polymerase sigma-70 factor (ECF subfamily)
MTASERTPRPEAAADARAAELVAVLRRARDGDLVAFNQLVVEHQGIVFNLCYRLLGVRAAAEDAAQEAFVSAWRNLGSLRGDAFRPWLLRIAANACKDELRKRRRRPSASLDVALEEGMPEPADTGPAPEPSVLQGELKQRVEAALGQLGSDQRLAIVLCDIEGLDYVEIAAAMGTSLGTVKSRIARGRARLRELLLSEPELLPSRYRPKV